MLTQHIALVPEAAGLDPAELSRVSAALQKQVTRDLGPLWGVSATVDAFQALEDVPVGYWPIVVTGRDLGRAAGIHLDRNGQPYARIGWSPLWSLDASRACLEMLINPYGDRTTTAPSPRPGQGMVELLVEVCAPCADARHGYPIHGILVSDFALPAFYGANPVPGRERHSFAGSLGRPFHLQRGGYLTWFDPGDSAWWMQVLRSSAPVELALGTLDQGLSCARDLVRKHGPARLWTGSAAGSLVLAMAREQGELALVASRLRARRLRPLLSQHSADEHEVLTQELPADFEYGDDEQTTVLLTAGHEEASVSACDSDKPIGEERPPGVAWLPSHALYGRPAPAPSTPPPPLPQRAALFGETRRLQRALPAWSRSAPDMPSPPPVEVLASLTAPPQRSHRALFAGIVLGSILICLLAWPRGPAPKPALPRAAALVTNKQPEPEPELTAPVARTPLPSKHRTALPTPALSAPHRVPRKASAKFGGLQPEIEALDDLIDTRR